MPKQQEPKQQEPKQLEQQQRQQLEPKQQEQQLEQQQRQQLVPKLLELLEQLELLLFSSKQPEQQPAGRRSAGIFSWIFLN